MFLTYRPISNIGRTLLGNEVVNQALLQNIFIPDLTPGFNSFGKLQDETRNI